jgi:hypothetical protein
VATAINAAPATDVRIFFIVVNLPLWFRHGIARASQARRQNQRFGVIMPPNVGIVSLNAFGDNGRKGLDLIAY